MKFYSNYSLLSCILFAFVWVLIQQSCTHDPIILDPDPDPMDTTTTPIDTMMIDTMDMGMPCDPDKVYFERDIQPILRGSCAFAGCHDANTASDGVILEGYDNVIKTADIVPFNLGDSELYEVITENDPDKVMPPTGKLENEKINLIAKWILQGATNETCDDSTECNTTAVSYQNFVKGVMSTSCNGCHGPGTGFGGVRTDSYSGLKSVVDRGRLYGAISWQQGFSRMPQGQPQLDKCTIDKIKSWIDAGAQNN